MYLYPLDPTAFPFSFGGKIMKYSKILVSWPLNDKVCHFSLFCLNCSVTFSSRMYGMIGIRCSGSLSLCWKLELLESEPSRKWLIWLIPEGAITIMWKYIALSKLIDGVVMCLPTCSWLFYFNQFFFYWGRKWANSYILYLKQFWWAFWWSYISKRGSRCRFPE